MCVCVSQSPSIETWLDMCGPVYEFYLGREQHTEGRAKSHFSLLRSLLHTNARFSDGYVCSQFTGNLQKEVCVCGFGGV